MRKLEKTFPIRTTHVILFNMIKKRKIEHHLKRLASQYPVVTITGPRQSGKTTLCKLVFPNKAYVSLEKPDIRRHAESDPNAFLKEFPRGVIIDEIQRVPSLLSYIQEICDTVNKSGFFILTGSQQFELMHNISQSLAGRTALITLLPFSTQEAYGTKKLPDITRILHTGFYPRIFDKRLNPTEAMQFYVSTYIERDIRSLYQVQNLILFETFLKFCAARTGQVVNLTQIGNDCGITHHTVKQWLSVLEASYIIKLIPPHFKNFNKRLIKMPKLYFLDTGLAAYLLDISEPLMLKKHPLRGALFETYIVSELLKRCFNSVQKSNLYYFRDSHGNEVDLILDKGIEQTAIEIKSSETIASDFYKNLNYYRTLNHHCQNTFLIYGGSEKFIENKTHTLGFNHLSTAHL